MIDSLSDLSPELREFLAVHVLMVHSLAEQLANADGSVKAAHFIPAHRAAIESYLKTPPGDMLRILAGNLKRHKKVRYQLAERGLSWGEKEEE